MPEKCNVLGMEYEVKYSDSLYEGDGVTDLYRKVIELRCPEKMLDKSDNEEDKFARKRETLRHELFHALFFESGLDVYAYDEILVSWLASQFPKVLSLFESMECLE